MNIFAALDLETTGLDPARGEVLELAIVPLNEDFTVSSDIPEFTARIKAKHPGRPGPSDERRKQSWTGKEHKLERMLKKGGTSFFIRHDGEDDSADFHTTGRAGPRPDNGRRSRARGLRGNGSRRR